MSLTREEVAACVVAIRDKQPHYSETQIAQLLDHDDAQRDALDRSMRKQEILAANVNDGLLTIRALTEQLATRTQERDWFQSANQGLLDAQHRARSEWRQQLATVEQERDAAHLAYAKRIAQEQQGSSTPVADVIRIHLLLDHLTRLEQQLAMAQNELCTANDQIPPDMDGDSLSVVLIKLKDQRRELREQLATVTQDLNQLHKRFADKVYDCLTLKQQLATAQARVAELTNRQGQPQCWKVEHMNLEAERDRLREALEGIVDIGKRDMTNTKYDGFFESAQQALKGTP